MTHRVLIVLAEPLDESRIRLNEEARVIEERLKLSAARVFGAVFCHAATLPALRDALLHHRPTILHFAGHGRQAGLLLEDGDGNGRVVSPETLARVLRQCRKKLYGVVMNACFSSANRKEFETTGIPYLISMNDEVDDDGAIAFSRAFYGAIAEGEDVDVAHDHGCAAYEDYVAEAARKAAAESGAEASETKVIPEASALIELHRNRAVRQRKCSKCGNAIMGRFARCAFCAAERTPVFDPDILKKAAAVVLFCIAIYGGYARWFARPVLEFDGESDDGVFLYFTIANSSLKSVSLSALTVEDSVLGPDVKIGTLTPRARPLVRWYAREQFAVNVNQVSWKSQQTFRDSHNYLSPRVGKQVVFIATVQRDGEPIELIHPVPIERLNKFLTIGHGTPPIDD